MIVRGGTEVGGGIYAQKEREGNGMVSYGWM